MGYIFQAIQRARAQHGPQQSDGHAAPLDGTDPAGRIDPDTDTPSVDADAPETDDRDAADAPASLPIGEIGDRVDERLIAVTDPSSMLAEEYRGIRTRLMAAGRRRHLVHTITSASRAEGKTVTSLNLACIFAEMADRSTIVIEGDLRVPTFRHMLRPDKRTAPGLIQHLRGEASIDEVIRPMHRANLSVIYAGGYASEGALQLLGGGRMGEFIAALRRRYDHVIIDTPPVLDVADAGVLGAMSDDVLLMLRMSKTSRRIADKAIEALRAYNAPVAGVVLTDVRSHAMSHGYKYGYRYAYGRAAA